jgi:hypothetical protein
VSQARNLGDILIELGKLTEADAERALAHQRDQGGYFGEALVTLGILSRGEIEWGLASQHDLPYVFPDPEAIDPNAAALVPPEWALANLTLPMMRTGDVLTVVVDSPLRIEAAAELARRVGCELRAALAAPARIRDAIRMVYSRGLVGEEGDDVLPCGLDVALAQIGSAQADRFGISIRDGRAWSWWDAGGTIHRRALDSRWDRVLSERMEPDFREAPAGPFEAHLSLGVAPTPFEVRSLEGEGGREILFRRRDDLDAAARRFTPPPEEVVSEVRILARSGAARILTVGRPPEAAGEVLVHLPTLFFEEGVRAVHLYGGGVHEGPGLGIPLSGETDERRKAIEGLRPFQFDIVTVALDRLDSTSLSMALDAAAVCFVLGEGPGDEQAAFDAGVRWRLDLTREQGGHLEWALHALER